jgi:hypothetical protein
MTVTVRPPRSPDFRFPNDVERWTRELRDYLDRVYADLVAAAGELTEKQPLDATLTAVAGLSSSAGLVEQTGPDAFTKRAIGVAASTSIPTRADADGRYVAGAGTVTDNALARFDGTAGRTLQNSGVAVDDSDNMTGLATADAATGYKVAGTQVVGAQGAAVADASGGATIDTEARAALNALLARARAHGLIAT